jgi:hypothetical protein
VIEVEFLSETTPPELGEGYYSSITMQLYGGYSLDSMD